MRVYTTSIAAVLIGGAVTGARAEDISDTTLLLTGRLFHRAVAAAADSPLNMNQEAALVMTGLRSSRDADLLPIFEKIRQSKSPDNQIYALVSMALLQKDAGMDPESKPNQPDLKPIFSSKDSAMAGSAIASLIDGQALSVQKLREILASSPDAAQKSMAAGELNRLKKLDDRNALKELLKNDKFIVRYYAAVTMLDSKDAGEISQGLAALNQMTDEHDLQQASIQALMLVRMQRENIAAGVPWAAKIAGDDTQDEGLRYTAIATVLALNGAEGPQILGSMIQKMNDPLQQVKLGLIAIDFAAKLKKEIVAPLLNTKSPLAAQVARIADLAAGGKDVTPDMVELLKEGQPIVLDWSLGYADHAAPARRMALRQAIINHATIVDNVRDQDYKRAATAAQKVLDDDGIDLAVRRQAIGELLKSPNRAIVDATLSGLYGSTIKNQSELVLPIWEGLTKTNTTENAANLAALILAREGRKESLKWLTMMVEGGTAQGAGFRALAGWYYAKLTGKADALLKTALAD